MTNEEMLVKLLQEMDKYSHHRVSSIALQRFAPRGKREEVLERIMRELRPWQADGKNKGLDRLQLGAEFPIDKKTAIKSIIIAAFLSGISEDDK